MDANAIIESLTGRVPAGAVEPVDAADGMPTVYIAPEHAVDVCLQLRDLPALRFAFFADMTAVDFLPREPRFEIVVHLASFGVAGFGDSPKRLRIKFRIPGSEPAMPTRASVWPASAWAEREVWDLFGIRFEGHPDLRRILMPDDWEGHPARKDYPVQIKMTPKVYEPLQLTPQEFVANVQAQRDRVQE